ncbi:MAG TPA: glycosyltransferase family 4 protein [Xanthobacteraceae bacterium]
MIGKQLRLAVVGSHPIQYQAPLFRELARRLDLTVFYAHRATPADQAKAGFGVEFTWDTDLLEGYEHFFLQNVARPPGLDRFGGCDTPEIGARLERGRFDAVLIHGWHLKAYLQAAYAAKRLGLPLLVRGDSQLNTPRSALKNAGKNAIYPILLRLVDAALYVGKRSYAYWRHYHYPGSRLFFSPHCVDTEWFASRATVAAGTELRGKLGLDTSQKTVLFAGKLVQFKRPLDLVDAAGVLRRDGCEISLIVAGAGGLSDEMIARATHLTVPLYHLGFCNQSEMPAVYVASDVLALPSDGNETWGLVANEALACGRPIVLSDAVGAGPDLADGVTTGRIFPVTDITALAGALGAVLSSPPSPQAIAAKSRAYSPAAAVDGVLAALNTI